jgi:hypothetical protein
VTLSACSSGVDQGVIYNGNDIILPEMVHHRSSNRQRKLSDNNVVLGTRTHPSDYNEPGGTHHLHSRVGDVDRFAEHAQWSHLYEDQG